jgi:predicted O-linked N-acetylglucosamine transferase (SPINDLY family)
MAPRHLDREIGTTGGSAQRAALVNGWLHRAVEAYRGGRWGDLALYARRVVEAEPGNANALALLGLHAAEHGRPDEAAGYFGRVVAAQPRDPVALNNYGRALGTAHRPAEAIAALTEALRLRPGYPDALNNRGVIFRAEHRSAEALADFTAALAGKPDFALAHANRGVVLGELGRHAEALTALDHAIALAPSLPDARFNRGNARFALRRPSEALEDYDAALLLRPDAAAAHRRRGDVLIELRRFDEALASFECALRTDRSLGEAFLGRGIALHELGRHEDALASFADAEQCAAAGLRASALVNRGHTLRFLRRSEESAAAYEAALDIDRSIEWLPGDALSAKARVCDWSGFAAELPALAAALERDEPVAAPFAVLGLLDSPRLQLSAARAWSAGLGAKGVRPVFAPPRPRTEALRIGYFSSDFHAHATAYLAAELIEAHDRQRVEVVGFSYGPQTNDPMQRRLAGAFDRFIDVRTPSDEAIAALSRSLGIDVAVDLKGYTENDRAGIFAHHAAPVQASYLGYPGTLAHAAVPYLVADPVLVPPGLRPHYAESIVYLPGSYQINDRRRAIGAGTPFRAGLGLPAEGFVFCCFNSPYKILPETFDSWSRILGQVEGSVLWLLDDNSGATRNLRREAARRGVDPERLVFAPRVALPEHLARHRVADLFLDTLPCNAHTTASDALWAGLPVLTLPGKSFAARVGASLLTAIGLPELIAETRATYEATAIALARDAPRLGSLRERLAANRLREPLFDSRRLTRHLEAAYAAMFERHRSGLPPADIVVPP